MRIKEENTHGPFFPQFHTEKMTKPLVIVTLGNGQAQSYMDIPSLFTGFLKPPLHLPDSWVRRERKKWGLWNKPPLNCHISRDPTIPE